MGSRFVGSLLLCESVLLGSIWNLSISLSSMKLECETLNFQLKLNSSWLDFKEQNRVYWTRFVKLLNSFKILLTNEIIREIWLFRKKIMKNG